MAYYLYGLADPPSTVATPRAVGGTATGSVTPNHAGLNDLLVRSVDRAGNVGPIADYRFYVASGVDPVAVYSMAGSGGTLADTGSPGGHPATLSGNAVQGGGVTSFNGTGTVPLGTTAVTSAVSGTGGRCMDISNSSNANGARIWLWDCHGLWNQVWQPQPNGSLKNPQSGRCLDISGYGTTNGTLYGGDVTSTFRPPSVDWSTT